MMTTKATILIDCFTVEAPSKISLEEQQIKNSILRLNDKLQGSLFCNIFPRQLCQFFTCFVFIVLNRKANATFSSELFFKFVKFEIQKSILCI
jgi:hypothetical protein